MLSVVVGCHEACEEKKLFQHYTSLFNISISYCTKIFLLATAQKYLQNGQVPTCLHFQAASCLYKFGECLKDDQSWGRLISTLPFLITGGKFEISRRSNFVRVVPPALLAYLVEEPRDNNLEARSDYKPAKLQTKCYKFHIFFCSKTGRKFFTKYLSFF